MKKGILVILDGYGEGKPNDFNAVINAHTPTLDKLKQQSYSLLKNHGEAVGLFEEEMGGSEVGHTTIGAGRIVNSTAKQIRDDILSGELAKNKTLIQMLENLKINKSDLHLFGLMSDKNIHSNINHCLEIVRLAKDKAKNIYIHFITDGRDCGAYDSLKYLRYLKNNIKAHQLYLVDLQKTSQVKFSFSKTLVKPYSYFSTISFLFVSFFILFIK